MKVRIYVEGGGDSKELHARCREGFSKLIEKAGFRGRMPGITACGGRQNTFEMFRTAVGTKHGFHPMLLVDSEDPLAIKNQSSPAGAWNHLQSRDGWVRPDGTNDDQAQMMVACMESWIMSDRKALRRVFGARLQTTALLPVDGIEQRAGVDVQQALEKATRNCGPDKAYRKGRRSFQVLAEINPGALMSLRHFKRFIEALGNRLPEGTGDIARRGET